jgi:hypothetical protein
MMQKKLEMLNYLNKRDKRIKFMRDEYKYTSLIALRKAKQLLWKIKANRLPLLQNASYCYSFVWIAGKSYECRKYYVVDIYDNITYARTLKNPSEIYKLPEHKDKVPYAKLYDSINKRIKKFLKSYGE